MKSPLEMKSILKALGQQNSHWKFKNANLHFYAVFARACARCVFVIAYVLVCVVVCVVVCMVHVYTHITLLLKDPGGPLTSSHFYQPPEKSH